MQPTEGELTAKLRELVSALGEPPLTPDESKALVAFAALVASWNHRVDLTGAKTAKDLVEVLLADALVMRDRALVPEGARVLDVGTGVGAPIVPFLVLRSDVHALCVEPRRKRVAFLRTAIGQLSLVPRMVVKEGRIEPNATELTDSPAPSVACSRATFAPETWLELGLKLAPRALLFAARDGLLDAPSGAELVAQRSYELPSTKSPRVLGSYARR
jgi:16S rRNA (guanine527-N7)-methyltransferase